MRARGSVLREFDAEKERERHTSDAKRLSVFYLSDNLRKRFRRVKILGDREDPPVISLIVEACD